MKLFLYTVKISISNQTKRNSSYSEHLTSQKFVSFDSSYKYLHLLITWNTCFPSNRCLLFRFSFTRCELWFFPEADSSDEFWLIFAHYILNNRLFTSYLSNIQHIHQHFFVLLLGLIFPHVIVFWFFSPSEWDSPFKVVFRNFCSDFCLFTSDLAWSSWFQ